LCFSTRVLAIHDTCLMPNQFHVVIRPRANGDLGGWVQWMLMAHARRGHRRYRTSSHVLHGRFKAFPIQDDDHLRTVVRSVERNALRAELVASRGLEVIEPARLAPA